MKLFEKFRWLPTEMPWPGTAEVSANSWLLAVFVGETPGIRSAKSRKLRPFSGRLLTSDWRHRSCNLAARRFQHCCFTVDDDVRLG